MQQEIIHPFQNLKLDATHTQRTNNCTSCRNVQEFGFAHGLRDRLVSHYHEKETRNQQRCRGEAIMLLFKKTTTDYIDLTPSPFENGVLDFVTINIPAEQT